MIYERKQARPRPRRWGPLNLSLAALCCAALTVWLSGEDETPVPAKPKASTHRSVALDPQIAADPFGVRDWGSGPSAANPQQQGSKPEADR